MLSSVPNTNVLRNLAELYLHVNKLENFDFLNKPNLYYLTLAFNQWDCDALNTVVSLNVLDRQQEQCSDGLHNHGICCQSKGEQDSQSFHKFKDLIWEAYNLKLQNKIFIDNNCRPPIQNPLTTNQINDKLATISNIEASKEPILQEISQVKEEFNRLNDQIVASQYETQTKTNQTSLLAKEIDRWRAIYGVEKEGFVEAGEVLRRIVQFLDSRKENSANLLKRREEEVSTSQGQERSKQNLVNTTKEDLETLKQIEKNFKQKEQSLRTQMNFLLAQVNKNSASLKGS
uniref:Uncharacterized protein n=2 Tax=Culex tarsalis TaxID=7177 RepID=A0A1Q3FNP4_CULTA